MHIAQQIIRRKKLEEDKEILRFTCFEKHYDQMRPLDAYFFTTDIVCVRLTHARTRNAFHVEE